MNDAARPQSARHALLGTYAADPLRYDELLDGGAMRPHWRALFEKLNAAQAVGITRRGLELTRRLVAESGVTYNVYADPKGADRPWALDPLPLIIPADEWTEIERGIAQRARLLDALLADLYGPQRLVAEGLVPPELVFGHPNFLWPAHGIVPREGCWLHIYAADLARAPDGRWWVLADRTQTPSGSGYALENRGISAQLLPDAMRDAGVRRLQAFLGVLRERLQVLADAGEEALAVVLTPGPFNETYFEHAYLARQLGLPLVEGSDLTVRGDTVFLKTLAGLQRVHGILRRLDDDFCDPLELRSDSALGVAGLLGVVRAQRVVLANALGTGVLESPAWLGFLPGVADRLLGESLLLPSLASWWCGEAPALKYVLEHLDNLVIRAVYPNQNFEPVFGGSVTGAARERLISRLCMRPQAYVAQERVALSQAPVLRGPGLPGFAAKAVTLRVYAFASDSGHMVMPGGLARVAADTSINAVTTQRGGASKDVWVLPDPQLEVDLTPPGDGTQARAFPVRHQRTPSRLVENLFWYGRYGARCEDKSRLLRATLAMRIDPQSWRLAMRLCHELDVITPDVNPLASLGDEGAPQGLIADIRRLAWSASQVRSRLSAGCWRTVTRLQQQLHEDIVARETPRQMLDHLLLSLAALAGFAHDDMTQDAGWRLMRIGRRLERLQFIARLLARLLNSALALQSDHVEWVLTACDSLRIYRPRYVSAPRLGLLLDLLIRDAQHPRALAFLWQAVERDLAELEHDLALDAHDGFEEAIPALSDERLLLMEQDNAVARQARTELAAQLQQLASAAGVLSDRISLRYFSHVSASQALAT